MDGFEPTPEEIDLLVRELNTVKRPVPKAPAAPQQPVARQSAATAPIDTRTPVGRWTSDQLNIPARPKPRTERTVALDALRSKLPKMPALPKLPGLPAMPEMPALPKLPALSQLTDLKRFIRVPSHVTIIRMWVALGAVHSAAMTFWPYEKGSPWGMVMYLLCLGMVLVTGVWGARLAWDQRLGAAHTIALGTVLWAVTLATKAVPSI